MHPKILLVSMTPFYGGGEVYCAKLANLLRERFLVGAAVANGRLAEILRLHEVPVWRLGQNEREKPIVRYPRAGIRLAEAIHEFGPDIVHLNGQAELYLSAIARANRVLTTSTRHTVFDNRVAALKRWLVAWNQRSIQRTICVSTLLRDQLSAVVDPERLVVIPNWIEPFPNAGTYNPRRKGETLKLLYVGRLVRDKGIFDLLEAIRGIEDVVLDVVGDGSQEREARYRAQNLPVRFHGFQIDCTRFYESAHLLVFPSLHEGQGLVPIEAMACGLPCLLSDIPTGRETADGGRTAEIFRAGDVEDLRSKILVLKEDSGRTVSLSNLGREWVKSRYSRERVQTALNSFFDSLIFDGERNRDCLEQNDS